MSKKLSILLSLAIMLVLIIGCAKSETSPVAQQSAQSQDSLSGMDQDINGMESAEDDMSQDDMEDMDATLEEMENI